MNVSNYTETNRYCSHSETESDIAKTLKLLTCLILGGFGIFGNVFVIVLAVKYTVTKRLHFLIVNMAIADTLFVFFHIHHFVTDGFHTYIWNSLDETIALVICKTFAFLYYVFTVEYLVTLLIISIERYRITRKSIQISWPLSRKRRLTVVGCSWLISTVMNLTLTFHFAQIESSDLEVKSCVINSTENEQLAKIMFIVYFALIILFFAIILFLSISTLRRISQSQAIEDSLSEVQRKQRRKRIHNAVELVLYSLLFYCFCYIPYAIVGFMTFYLNFCIRRPIVLFLVFYAFPLANSCLSPCIYCVCLSDFREAAKRLIRMSGNWSPQLDQRNSIQPN